MGIATIARVEQHLKNNKKMKTFFQVLALFLFCKINTQDTVYLRIDDTIIQQKKSTLLQNN